MQELTSLTTLCASLCKCMGVEPPEHADKANDAFVNDITGGKLVDKVVMYNPDAVGTWIVNKYAEKFVPVRETAPYELKMRTVFPPKTPVCFASMYTGALPAVHGIQKYVKPVVKIDTIFDALLRQGKKPAIVASKNSSLNHIFREREMDYYVVAYDKEATEKGIELIKEGKYDFLVIYNQEYDDSIHFTHPKSWKAKRALDHYAENFKRIGEAVAATGERTLLGYGPDHGVHREWYLLGNHGKDIPKDMEISHFYRVYN